MNREELAARRERYFDLVASGMNFTAAAHSRGTGVWPGPGRLAGVLASD